MGKQFIAFALLIAASSIAIASDVSFIPTGDGLLKGGVLQEFGRKHVPSRLQRRTFEEKIAQEKKNKEEEAKRREEQIREEMRQQMMKEYGPPAPETKPSVPPGYNGYEQDLPFFAEPSAPPYELQHDGRFDPHVVPPASYLPQQVEGLPGSHQTYGVVGQPHGRVQHGGMDINTKRSVIKAKLERIVSVNRLEVFYNEQRIENILDKLVKVDFVKKAEEWDLSQELIYDLVALALYDVVFFCDDSGSMIFNKADGRITELRMILKKISDIAILFDDDGVDVRFMNSDIEGKNIKTATDVDRLIPGNFRFSGETPLGGQFNAKVLQPLVVGPASKGNLEKPVLAICITDGQPSDSCFPNVIVDAKNALSKTTFDRITGRHDKVYGSGAVAIGICQVGKDKGAQKYVGQIDKHPVVGHMVDATSSFELEEKEFLKKGVELTVPMWWAKISIGAIDPDYDAADE